MPDDAVTFDLDLDDPAKFMQICFEYDGVYTYGDKDKEKRERIRRYALREIPPHLPEVHWWAFRISLTKSGKADFDVENVPKIIVDAFSREQIGDDHSEYVSAGLYSKDTIDFVRAVLVQGKRVETGDHTKVEIFGRLRDGLQ